jgi:hypothetical protein
MPSKFGRFTERARRDMPVAVSHSQRREEEAIEARKPSQKKKPSRARRHTSTPTQHTHPQEFSH